MRSGYFQSKVNWFGSLLMACLALAAPQLRAADDVVIADFEGGTYGDWKTTGEAFGPSPASGALPGQMVVTGFKGKGLVNSFFKGDASTGTLTSPEFKLERPFITFLIGGGKNLESTCMRLMIEGKAIRTATGPNDKDGGTEALEPGSWDVTEFLGKKVSIQIVDLATGGWGHINVDHIVQTDRKPASWVADAKRDIKVGKRYLNLPIKNGAAKRMVTTLVDGRVEVKNEIELADAAPDWWAFVDAGAWQGKTVTFKVDKLPDDSTALTSIDQSDAIKGAENLFKEPLRGQFHFSSRRGWINDPNGMVFFNGEYHLFYQHNPYGIGWGNMHWGHAVSRDMIHWKDLGDKLMPDDSGPMFSGSAVVDWKNTSGFGKPGKPPLVLTYTAAGHPTVQSIAYSTDGRTFTKYEHNPVVKEITDGNRDPKIIWHEPTKKWVMVLYVGIGNKSTVHIMTSPNLREWTLASVVEGGKDNGFLFECPDFFELPVDGNTAKMKWVLFGANSEYTIGSFDGTSFAAEMPKYPGQRGLNYYAPQTFSDTPDGRRIQMGWFQVGPNGMPFHHAMSIPQELKLITTPEGPRMTRTPVKELESLRAKSHKFGSLSLSPDNANPLAGIKAELVELRVEFTPGDASEVILNVRGASVVYDAKRQELVVNGHRAPAPLQGGMQRITVYCDRVSLEVFASDGLTYVPMAFQPKADNLTFGIQAKGGNTKIDALQVYELKSAWDAK